MLRVDNDAPALFPFWMPINAPELATAYRAQPRAAVPNALLLIVIAIVELPPVPIFVIPVIGCVVAEVAQPRRVLLLMFTDAPVVLQRMKTVASPPEVAVDVRVPLLLRLPAFRVYPVRMLSTSPFPMVLFEMLKVPAEAGTSMPANPPLVAMNPPPVVLLMPT